MSFSITIILPITYSSDSDTSHTLINKKQRIRKALDNGNVCCRVFEDLQKAFDTGPLDTLSKTGSVRDVQSSLK